MIHQLFALPLSSVTDNQVSNGTVLFLFWFTYQFIFSWLKHNFYWYFSKPYLLDRAHQHPCGFALICTLTSTQQKMCRCDSTCHNMTFDNHVCVCTWACVYIYTHIHSQKEMVGCIDSLTRFLRFRFKYQI